MKKLTKATQGLIGQPMFKLLQKVKEMERAGRKIYRFEIGDSSFGANNNIIEATKAALDQGHTHYVESIGIPPLKYAIAEHILQSQGFKPAFEQTMVIPANAVIDFVIRCVVEPGEEVIVPDPGFPTYFAVTSYYGAKKITIPLREENGFRLNPDDLEKKVSDKTRLIIINSPQNPTGAVLGKDEIKAIFNIAEKHDTYILSDEIYSRIIYDHRHVSPGIFDQCKERVIILNGFSKGYSMAGWRLGFAIGPEELIEKMGVMFQTIYSCTST